VLVAQDMVVYGVLALLFLLTIILLGVDVGDVDSYSQFIPESTAHVHIAALVLLLICFSNCLFTSDKGGGKCDCARCLSVCLSVSKITQKHVHGFG